MRHLAYRKNKRALYRKHLRFTRRREPQRTALRWQRGMVCFIYNLLMVIDSALKLCRQIYDKPQFVFRNLREIECLDQTLSEKSIYIFLSPLIHMNLFLFLCICVLMNCQVIVDVFQLQFTQYMSLVISAATQPLSALSMYCLQLKQKQIIVN